MRLRPLLAVALAATAAALALPAGAETPAWVATYPVGTGAQHRLAALPEGDVWAVVEHSRVLRSTDAGLTWLPVNPVPVQFGGVPLPGTGPAGGGSSETLVAPVSRTVAYGANGSALSVTRDSGLTWTQVEAPPVTRSGFEGTSALEASRGRLWSGRTGFEVDDLCPVPPRTTAVQSSTDGKRFVRADVPYPAGQVMEFRFATPQRGAALVIDFVYGEPVRERNSCSVYGEATTSSVWVTEDAGRRWRKGFTCRPSCYSIAWSGSSTLVAAGVDGKVAVSRDAGRRFTPSPSVPLGPNPLAFVQAVDCRGPMCLASVNGGGIFRSDGFGDQWVREPSGQEAYALSLGDLAIVDADRAVSGGPNALFTRTSTPTPSGAAPAPTAPLAAGALGPIALGGGAVRGLDGVVRKTWTVTR